MTMAVPPEPVMHHPAGSMFRRGAETTSATPRGPAAVLMTSMAMIAFIGVKTIEKSHI
jgi:hypothetical protein